MPDESADRLRTPDGVRALALAARLPAQDPLAAASAMRAAGFDAGLAGAALTQVALRQRARAKFGPDADRMFFTRTGLEQATRGIVATRRAARLATALGVPAPATTAAPGQGAPGPPAPGEGARPATSAEPLVADLGCGIGADTLAMARAGLRVRAVEADPGTAAIARINAEVHPGRVEVLAVQAQAVDLHDVAAVFCDPARRTTGGRRVFSPAAYSPPWDFVLGLPARVPHTVLKLAPGIDHALIPPGVEAEWVSVDWDVVEAALWCGPLAATPRRATVLRGDAAYELTGSGTAEAEVAPPGRYLYDPDGAVVRAHLIAELAASIGATIADPAIAYLYTAAPVATPFARVYEIFEAVPVAVKKMRAALRAHGIGRLTIAKRGSALDVEWLRRELRLAGDAEATLVLTRVAGAPAAWLCRAVPPPPPSAAVA
ncbi:MAG TPA: class I SAM-dependent methyltransferase [Micromonosporaceae bacterium]|nr:class I SAM-dependent methyltransferase [Micromonosporaceae bacterium]